jgi:uncharacterized coiled-coil protein SlyX
MAADTDTLAPSSDNVCDMIGFLHYQLSHQAKEIALLNRRVAELMQSGHEHNIALYIASSNQRFDSFANSIKGITDRFVHYDSAIRDSADSVSAAIRTDFEGHIQKIETRVIDSERAAGDRLEIRIAEVRSLAAAQDDALSELQAEVALLKRKRESSVPSLHFMPIADIRPASADAFRELQAEVRELRALAGRGGGGVDRGELAAIHGRIDECAKKSELWQPAAHVRLISGECLKRPVTQHLGKLAKLRPRPPDGEAPQENSRGMPMISNSEEWSALRGS